MAGASRARVRDTLAAEWLAPGDLRPWPGNPRNNDGAVNAVRASIEAFGWGEPIVARAANREIIAGHTRWKAAMAMGLDRVPVRLLNITAKKAHALALADNRLGEISTWNDAGLREALAALSAEDRKVAGFAAGMIDETETSADSDEDAEPTGETSAQSRAGEVYRLGRHVLVCGDSTDAHVTAAALAGDAPRLMLFDPPYDDAYDRWVRPESVDVIGVWWRSRSALAWVAGLDDKWGVHTLVFTGGSRGQINLTLPCCQHEQIMVARRSWWADKHDALDREVVRRSGANKTSDDRHISWQATGGGGAGIGEKWQKPTLQAELLCAYVPAGSVVYDPCAGSGSSLIAAAKHGRLWRGVEMDPVRVDEIRKRWARNALALCEEVGDGIA
jgi:hypothetical protein